jgi:hypothetical protein
MARSQQRHSPPAPPKKLSIEERKQRLQQRFSGQLTQLAFEKAINALTDRELLYLEQAVKEYFAVPVAQVPDKIDRQAIENEISQLQPQIDSLWSQHAIQEKAIAAMERFPLHKLSNKYNLTLEKQLQTIETIKELVTYQQQLQSLIQEFSTQVENHHSWEKQQQTIEMKTIAEVLKLPSVQERLDNIKEGSWRKEQQRIAELASKNQSLTKPHRVMKR